jgi:hypothetical protein
MTEDDSTRMQRHPIYPSMIVSSPEDYPEPKAGNVTRLALTTVDGEPVGTLLYDDRGLSWTPASTEDDAAQEYAAELLGFLRGNKEEGTSVTGVIEAIRDAYTGDFKEDQVKYIPAQ